MKKLNIILSALVLLVFASSVQARDQIKIVGSSTVYPYATVVAETFGKGEKFKTPVIESTGTGGGMKLFCAGVGTQHPDITNASRAIKSKEKALCEKNGVTEIIEIVVGNDGITFAHSVNASDADFTKEQLWRALAAKVDIDGKLVANPYKKWSDIDSSLPSKKIEIMIAPPTSGTRDAMGSLFMKNGWKKLGLYSGDTKSGYKVLREDGVAMEMGENDNLMVEKLVADPNAFGIFGYSFFDTNRDKVQSSIVDNIELTFDNIASYEYPGARPLFFYVKNDHIHAIPNMLGYIEEFVSERAMSIDGYLFPAGLVPLSDEDYAKQVDALLTIQ